MGPSSGVFTFSGVLGLKIAVRAYRRNQGVYIWGYVGKITFGPS